MFAQVRWAAAGQRQLAAFAQSFLADSTALVTVGRSTTLRPWSPWVSGNFADVQTARRKSKS